MSLVSPGSLRVCGCQEPRLPRLNRDQPKILNDDIREADSVLPNHFNPHYLISMSPGARWKRKASKMPGVKVDIDIGGRGWRSEWEESYPPAVPPAHPPTDHPALSSLPHLQRHPRSMSQILTRHYQRAIYGRVSGECVKQGSAEDYSLELIPGYRMLCLKAVLLATATHWQKANAQTRTSGQTGRFRDHLLSMPCWPFPRSLVGPNSLEGGRSIRCRVRVKRCRCRANCDRCRATFRAVPGPMWRIPAPVLSRLADLGKRCYRFRARFGRFRAVVV